jgi:hypothetical protein
MQLCPIGKPAGLRQDERALLGAQLTGDRLGAVEIQRIVTRLGL